MRKLPLSALLPLIACADMPEDSELGSFDDCAECSKDTDGGTDSTGKGLTGDWIVELEGEKGDEASSKLSLAQDGTTLSGTYFHATGEWFAEVYGVVTPSGNINLTGHEDLGDTRVTIKFHGETGADGASGDLDVKYSSYSDREWFAEIYAAY